MKQTFFASLFLFLVSCKKSKPEIVYTQSTVKKSDLCGDYWKVFKTATISIQKFSSLPDTTKWVEYVDYESQSTDRVIIFRSDSTYECDDIIAYALSISEKGRYIPNAQPSFDTLQFITSYGEIHAVGILKSYPEQSPESYSLQLNIHWSKPYYQHYGYLILKQVN